MGRVQVNEPLKCILNILNVIENASSILEIHISCDTDHGSPGAMPHPLPFI